MRISDDIMQVIKQLGDEALFQEHERTSAEETIARQRHEIADLEIALVELQQQLVAADAKAAKYKRKYFKLKRKHRTPAEIIRDEARSKATDLGRKLNYEVYWEAQYDEAD